MTPVFTKDCDLKLIPPSETTIDDQLNTHVSIKRPLREKSPNTEFSLIHIFLYSHWLRSKSPYSVRIQENRTRKNSVFGLFSRSGSVRISASFSEGFLVRSQVRINAQVRLRTHLKLVTNLNKVKEGFCDQFGKEFWKEFWVFCEKSTCFIHFIQSGWFSYHYWCFSKYPRLTKCQVQTSAREKAFFS